MALTRQLKRCLALVALFGLVAADSDAATNARFEVSLPGGALIRQFRNPEVGQLIVLGVLLSKTTEVKGGLVDLKYDGAFFEYVGFAPGTHPSLPGAFPGEIETINAFDTDPEVGADGLSTVQAGGTLLGDVSDVSGGGLFGRFFFRLLQVPGDERPLGVSI